MKRPILLILLVLMSCGEGKIHPPSDLLGNWVGAKRPMELNFLKDSLFINSSPAYTTNYLWTNDTLTVEGSIGDNVLFKSYIFLDSINHTLKLIRLDGGENSFLIRPKK